MFRPLKVTLEHNIMKIVNADLKKKKIVSCFFNPASPEIFVIKKKIQTNVQNMPAPKFIKVDPHVWVVAQARQTGHSENPFFWTGRISKWTYSKNTPYKFLSANNFLYTNIPKVWIF